LKTKCHQVGQFVAIGFVELDGGRVEALHLAELRDGKLVPAGVVKFGLRGLWPVLDQVRARRARGTVPLQIPLKATVKYFGRSSRYIRDAVLLDLSAGWILDELRAFRRSVEALEAQGTTQEARFAALRHHRRDPSRRDRHPSRRDRPTSLGDRGAPDPGRRQDRAGAAHAMSAG